MSRSDGDFTCQTGTENPFLLNSSFVNGLASSTCAVVMKANMQNASKCRVSNLSQLVLTSTWRTLDGPLCANVLDTCHMLYETAVKQLMSIGQGHGNTLESHGHRGGPMGTAVEIC